MLFFFFWDKRVNQSAEWGQSEERSCRSAPVTVSCMFDLTFLWGTSAGDVTMAHVLFPSAERLGPLNHKWHPGRPQPGNNMSVCARTGGTKCSLKPSTHLFAHRCRLHSRLHTIASNYPHFFPPFFNRWWNPHRACLSCVCVVVVEAQREGVSDREGKEIVCVWVSGVGVCLFGL